MNGSRTVYNCQFCDDFETKTEERKIGFRRKQLVIVLSLATVSPQSVIHCAMIPAAI